MGTQGITIDNIVLRKLQLTELEILNIIDEFCKENNIKYSLYAGTALGAVRHKGFIPWDDDVDIAMTRSDFNKFCNKWKEKPPSGYYLESIITDACCGTCHAKVRKLGTLFLQSGEIEGDGHHEIWVDIFPLDKISFDPIVRRRKYKKGKELIFLTRSNNYNKNYSTAKKIIIKALKLIPQDLKYKRVIDDHMWLLEHEEDGNDNGFEWKSMSTLKAITNVSFPFDLNSSYDMIQFEDGIYSIFQKYDLMLEISFGDYMKLPPEKERVCKHNPIKIQF